MPKRRENKVLPDGRVLRHYEATVEDVLKVVEAHGREISLTKMQLKLRPIAGAHHFKFVDWGVLKTVVTGMVVAGMLVQRPTLGGYYRYDLPDR
jgi:hypothetical protein